MALGTVAPSIHSGFYCNHFCLAAVSTVYLVSQISLLLPFNRRMTHSITSNIFWYLLCQKHQPCFDDLNGLLINSFVFTSLLTHVASIID